MDRPKREKFLPKKFAKETEIEKKLNKISKNRFQCSYCNSNYARKASLINHVKQKHQDVKSNKLIPDIENEKNVDDQTDCEEIQTEVKKTLKLAKVETEINNGNQTPDRDVKENVTGTI